MNGAECVFGLCERLDERFGIGLELLGFFFVRLDFPSEEEVFPADERDNLFDRNRRELAFAHERRLYRLVFAPVVLETAFFRRRSGCCHGVRGFGFDAVLLVADALLLFAVFLNRLFAGGGVEQFLGKARIAGGVTHMENRAVIAWGNFHGGMRGRGRGTTDDYRNALTGGLHSLCDRTHFFERRRDKTGEAQDICFVFNCSLDDDIFRNHHAEVHHVIAVTGHNHGDNVLADIMHVALDGRDDYFTAARCVCIFACFDVRLQNFHSFFHRTCGFHDLREEHLAFTETTADFVHTIHQWARNNANRAIAAVDEFHQVGLQCCRSSLEEGFLQTFFGRGGLGVSSCVAFVRRAACACAYGENGFRVVLGASFLCLGLGGRHAACNFDEFFACFRFRVEDDFGNRHAEFKRNCLVLDNRARIHDRHAHAVRDGVMQERGVHRFAQVVVATECEREVRKTARDADTGEVVHNPADRADKVNGVGVVFRHAGSDRQNVRVVNDIGRVEVKLLHHDIISAGRNLYAALVVCCLAFFVEEHHDYGGTEALHGECVFDKRFFAHLERDGVHDALALDALEAFFDNFEAGAIDHDRHAAYSRVGSNQVQESAHFGGGVEEAIVHVDVNDVGAVIDLLTGDVERFFVILLVDETQELLGARDVATFADLHEIIGIAAVGAVARANLFSEQRFEPRKAEARACNVLWSGFTPLVVGRERIKHLAHRGDMFWSRTAATANHVHELVVQINAHQAHHVFGRVVITAELVRKTCVRMATEVARSDSTHAAEVRHHAICTETAV